MQNGRAYVILLPFNQWSRPGNQQSVESLARFLYHETKEPCERKDFMKKTLGMLISETRKQKGMTQLELAEKMGVTDKAVSKWERDLSHS